MTRYIIVKKVRSLNYYFSEKSAMWQGLKENASTYSFSEAIGWKQFLEESNPGQTFEIIEHHGTKNTTPGPEETVV